MSAKPNPPRSPQAGAAADPKKKPATESRTQRTIAIVGGVLAGLATLYGVGRFQGHAETQAADQRTQEAEKQKERATSEFDAQRDRAIRLEARRRLHLALIALDDRNYGIAEGHVERAATLLERAKGLPALDALAADLRGVKLAPSGEPSASREKVFVLVKRFDDALPPAEP